MLFLELEPESVELSCTAGELRFPAVGLCGLKRTGESRLARARLGGVKKRSGRNRKDLALPRILRFIQDPERDPSGLWPEMKIQTRAKEKEGLQE